MSETKIKVPEGMLKVTIDRMEMPNTEPCRVQVGKALEAALRWQSENSVKPSQKVIDEIYEYLPGCGPETVADQWVRRMFIAPEPPRQPQGVLPEPFYSSLRVGEGLFSSAGVPLGIWDGEYIRQWGGEPTVPEPEVPAAITDLLYDPKDGPTKIGRNDAVIEAYSRGLKAGAK